MRSAELVMAVALMGLAVFFMVHATVLPVGWVRGTGPGGGAFPFWLSAIMLGCGAIIALREIAAWSSAIEHPHGFIPSPDTRTRILVVIVLLLATVAAMRWLGTYVAIPALLLMYLRFLGRHRWIVTLPIVLVTPVVLFLFFEVTLKIILPKGVTEPVFLPLYAFFF